MSLLRYSGLVVLALVLGALAISPAAAQCQVQPGQAVDDSLQGNLTFTIGSAGITGDLPLPAGGLYNVTVRNDTSRPRGIVMTGIDKCCSPYTRFTRVLQPGAEVSFRWYFPPDRVVQLRDLIRCQPAARTCTLPKTGGMSSKLTFG